MSSTAKKLSGVITAGLLFGIGLALSGMTHAEKVLGFLDITGDWDASLLFVLGGAVTVTLIAFRFILKRPKPLVASNFDLPIKTRIDRALIVGAILFGIGWGITGYCPGPAIALLAAPGNETLIVITSLALGRALYEMLERRHAK